MAVIHLPLAWGNIKGWYSKADELVHITWKLTDEKDVGHFIIERSADGIHFTQAGIVTAIGNLIPSDYLFKDAGFDKSRKLYHYRIGRVSINGSVKYSATIAVNFSAINKDLDVQVIPNPAQSNDMKIRLANANNSAQATLSVADASGKLLVSKQVILTASPQSFMPSVQAGIYFLTVKTENYINVIRVIVE